MKILRLEVLGGELVDDFYYPHICYVLVSEYTIDRILNSIIDGNSMVTNEGFVVSYFMSNYFRNVMCVFENHKFCLSAVSMVKDMTSNFFTVTIKTDRNSSDSISLLLSKAEIVLDAIEEPKITEYLEHILSDQNYIVSNIKNGIPDEFIINANLSKLSNLPESFMS